MENATLTVEFFGALFTLLGAIASIYFASKSKKSQENSKEIENNIEKIKNEMMENINSKNKIAAIAEIKSRTEVIQRMLSKYQRIDALVGYDLHEDISDLDSYMSVVKEKNWIFENEGINISDRLYDDLYEIANNIDAVLSSAEMKEIYSVLRPKLENYKSALSKISNRNIIN